MEDDGFTRLDSFDFEDDLSDYYAMTDKQLRKQYFTERTEFQKQNILVFVTIDRFIKFITRKKSVKITPMLKLCLNIYGV